MTAKIIKDGKLYYKCSECGFIYKSENLAHKCEDYCKKYHACSTGITKHAIKI